MHHKCIGFRAPQVGNHVHKPGKSHRKHYGYPKWGDRGHIRKHSREHGRNMAVNVIVDIVVNIIVNIFVNIVVIVVNIIANNRK